MVSEVIGIRDNTDNKVTSENLAVDNSSFATVGVDNMHAEVESHPLVSYTQSLLWIRSV